MKKYQIFLFLIVGCLITLPASAITITAEAFGSTSLTPIDANTYTQLVNQDFVITQDPTSCCSTLLGDGNNDDTAWSFDFGTNANLFSNETLSSAMLTLSLTNVTGGISSDTIEIVGLGARAASEIRGLPAGTNSSITFDLLQYYSSSNILGELFDPSFGQLNMIYEDDAVVHYARLSLSSVPEPATLALMGLGLAGIGYRRKVK